MKLLHLADLHIRERDAEEINRVLQFIVETAQRENPDLAVIAGDIFDSRDVKVDSQSAIMAIGFVSALMDTCPVAIILGTPSHDGAAPRIMKYARGKYDCIVAESPKQVYLEDGFLYDRPAGGEDFKTPECIVTLIPQPTKQYWQGQGGVGQTDQEIGQAMSGVFAGFGAQAKGCRGEYEGVPHILVYHGGISGAKVSTGQTLTGHDIEVSIDQLNLCGADLNLCGHIHMQQQLGDRTFYAGSPYRTNWGEAEAKGFYLHEGLEPGSMDGIPVRAEARFIETPCKRAVRITRDLRDPENIEPMYADGAEGAFVRIDLTVWQDEAEKIDREAITREWRDAGAVEVDIRITRVPRETVRAESVLKAETLRAKIEERARIVGEEVDPEVLGLADLLQGSKAEELLKQVMGGAA